MTAAATDRTVSFADPLAVTGRLRAANGTPLANRTATFRVGATNLTATTNATGGFRLTYRPTALASNASFVSVRFVPESRSLYRTSNASVPVSVRQADPTVRLAATPDRAAYNRTLRVRGTVTVDGTPVADAPVRLTASDEFVGNATTAENGTFALAGRFPGTPAENRTELEVSLPLGDAALSSGNATATVPVERVGTSLSLDASRDGTTLRATGRLTADDGDPLSDRAVHVRVGGAVLAVVETDDAGRYRATISVPKSARRDGNVTANATFDGNRGLTPARASERIGFPPSGGPESVLETAVLAAVTAPWWALLLAGSGIAVAAYLAVGRFRPTRDEGAESGPTPTELDAGVGEFADSGGRFPDETSGASRTHLLALARQRLDRGDPESAASTVYAAVRRRLAVEIETDPAVTHVELYARCRDAGLPEDRLDDLREVTQAYERAQFSSHRLPTETAADALRAGSSLVEESEIDADATARGAD
ncbi:hypothetical protein [Halorussus caseinilyticus]|uniref:DUF4129 domain-containing protein n=1 Tax=Halorussus caseinilyticus TaxID=3034025 RepID=A0ABD5WF67_9EURY